MPDQFDRTIPLSQATKFVVDNRGRTAPTSSSGIALIATNCVSNDDLYPAYLNVRYVSDETYRNWFRSHPVPGDILLTLKGSQNGAVCLAPDPVDFVIAQDMVALRADETIIDPLFLFAALRSASVQHQIKNLDVSGVIPHLKKGDFDKLLLPYPPRELQQFIGFVYFSLSAKIELSRRMNKTLQAMAKALFRDWFVDFGPTRAKLRGSEPYLDHNIWSLFPDQLDGEGKPEGWTQQGLDSIATFLNGLALQKYPASGESSLPVIKIAELRSGVTAKSDRASTGIPSQFIVDDGDVLFSWSGSLTHLFWTGGKGALNQHLFKVTSELYPKWFYYLWLSEHMPGFQAIASSKATTMGHIQRHHLTEATCVVPDHAVLKAADGMIAPLVEKLIANELENRSLTNLRDLLLPKLMSGELRIEGADKTVGQAA